ncbi:MAG: thioredoxin family protein [Terrimicrobiaceae bacterium]|nr:thioredoxin family protein [Terrimicrobiaceae bacterium]
MKNNLIAAVILCLLGGGLSWVLLTREPEHPVAMGGSGLVLMNFSADWCPPCRTMKPVVRELAGELQGSVDVVEINVDQNPSLAAQYNIRSLPTFIVTRGGQEIARRSGAMSKESLRAMTAH